MQQTWCRVVRAFRPGPAHFRGRVAVHATVRAPDLRIESRLYGSSAVTSTSGPLALPFVLVPCDNRLIGGQYYHALGHKYADAVRLGADCLPLIAPTGGAT